MINIEQPKTSPNFEHNYNSTEIQYRTNEIVIKGRKIVETSSYKTKNELPKVKNYLE